MRKALLLLLAAALAAPASAQVDLARFVQLGDSWSAGYLDACWAEHGQRAAWGAVLARQAGTGFEQPLLAEPGVGTGLGAGKGCLVLKDLFPAPAFTRKESVLTPLNAGLARSYDDLAVPGYRVRDVTDTKTSAENGNPLTDVVLRGKGTALAQAAALRPTFVTVQIGMGDVLPAIGTATVIQGITLPPLETVVPKVKQIFDTLKAAQGTARGVALTLPNMLKFPFLAAISPVISLGGRTITDPFTGKPMTYLSRVVDLPSGQTGPIAPIPLNSAVTLNAAAFIATGTGIPCSAFTAAGIPAGDPRRANCDKPLPDDIDPVANTPGVVLYPNEIASLTSYGVTLNNAVTYFAGQAGYRVFDTEEEFFADFVENGRKIGGVTFTEDFLSGGFFSYDGINPSVIGHALFAREVIKYLNRELGASLPDVDLAPYFDGAPGAGGLATTPQERLEAAATIFTPEGWRAMKGLFGLFDPPAIVVGDDAPPLAHENRGAKP